MNNELILKKCDKCGAIVRVMNASMDAGCDDAKILKPNSVDASFEKHLPVYELVEDEIFVKVPHVMEKEHYIEWIAMVTDDREEFAKLFPEQNAEVRFKYVPGAKLYAYCNKHGLWMSEVK